MGSPLDQDSVQRVQAALTRAGSQAKVMALTATARTAAEAAAALGVEVGAIVKSLVFLIGDEPVMVLVAGDRRCREAALPAAFSRRGKVVRADAGTVRAATGFAIGGVAPVGLVRPLPVVIDAALSRFATVYAAAGHPYCVFATTLAELRALTGGVIRDGIAADANAG